MLKIARYIKHKSISTENEESLNKVHWIKVKYILYSESPKTFYSKVLLFVVLNI